MFIEPINPLFVLARSELKMLGRKKRTKEIKKHKHVYIRKT